MVSIRRSKRKKEEQEAGPASDAGQLGSSRTPSRGPRRPPEVVQAKYTLFIDRDTNCTCLVSG